MPGAASTPERTLVVNADDFGLSTGVNQGIICAHEEGIVTSASLMVRQPAAAEAAAYARDHSRLSVGLHLNLAEWVFRDGEWFPLYQVVRADNEKAMCDVPAESWFHRFCFAEPAMNRKLNHAPSRIPSKFNFRTSIRGQVIAWRSVRIRSSAHHWKCRFRP